MHVRVIYLCQLRTHMQIYVFLNLIYEKNMTKIILKRNPERMVEKYVY